MSTDTPTLPTVFEFAHVHGDTHSDPRAFIVFDGGLPKAVLQELKDLCPIGQELDAGKILRIIEIADSHGVVSFTYYTTHNPTLKRLELSLLIPVVILVQDFNCVVFGIAQYSHDTAPVLPVVNTGG